MNPHLPKLFRIDSSDIQDRIQALRVQHLVDTCRMIYRLPADTPAQEVGRSLSQAMEESREPYDPDNNRLGPFLHRRDLELDYLISVAVLCTRVLSNFPVTKNMSGFTSARVAITSPKYPDALLEAEVTAEYLAPVVEKGRPYRVGI